MLRVRTNHKQLKVNITQLSIIPPGPVLDWCIDRTLLCLQTHFGAYLAPF